MHVQQARDHLMESLRGSAGRDVTVAEAMTLLGAKGRRVIALAEAERKAAKKAAKKKAAEESVLRARVNARITEALSAAQAPAPPPGTGEAGVGDLFGGTEMHSPFWQPSGTTAAGSAPEPAKPLHEMSADEFRAHATGTLDGFGRAAGFRSPVWQ